MLESLFVDHSAVWTNFQGLAAVTLLGHHELDAAMAVLVDVPVDKRGHPLTGWALKANGFRG